MEIHEQLKKHRKAKGLTQQQLADKMNVSVQYISQVENGRIATLHKMKDYAEYLDCEISVFVTPK